MDIMKTKVNIIPTNTTDFNEGDLVLNPETTELGIIIPQYDSNVFRFKTYSNELKGFVSTAFNKHNYIKVQLYITNVDTNEEQLVGKYVVGSRRYFIDKSLIFGVVRDVIKKNNNLIPILDWETGFKFDDFYLENTQEIISTSNPILPIQQLTESEINLILKNYGINR